MKTTITAFMLFVYLWPMALWALEVDREVIPRMTLGGRVIASMDSAQLDSDPQAEDEFNLADSSLLMRFDKRAYASGVAGAVVGITEHESEAVFHQLHAFYWNRHYSTLLGRTRLKNTVIEFPLVRDDDLLAYTHVGNASSNGEFDQIYADQLAFDWIVDNKIQSASLWFATRANGEQPGFDDAPGGIDSMGAGWVLEQAEDLVYVSHIRHAGILLDRQKVNTPNGNEWMHAVIAGLDVNLNRDATGVWSLAFQAIANEGVDDITVLDTVAQRAQAKSDAFVSSLRYTHRPHLLTRWQAAITLAFKDYADVSAASHWSVAPNFVYRIGQGVEVFTQLKYSELGNAVGDGTDTVIQAGISFNLEAMFNDNIGERDSILNLEHGYID